MLNWKDVEKNLRAAAFARPKLEAKFKDFADSLGVLKRLTIQPHQDIQISGLAENNSFTSTFLGQKLRFSFSVFLKDGILHGKVTSVILPQIDEEPIFLSTFTFDQNGISSLINPHDQSFIPIGDDSDFAAAILMSFIHEGLSKPSQSLAVVELSRVDK